MSTGQEKAKTSKGARTRARILETALDLFLERGYEKTTMRAIGAAAGVSLGNAYYYFPSKEALIQAFYARTHDQHLAASRPLLAGETDLAARLKHVLRAKIDTIMPYHQFAGVLFRTAADPASPLNPFSPESRQVREDSTRLFAQVISGADTRIPGRLRNALPELLWLYSMGITLFWVHDRSPDCRRTYRLLDTTSELVVRLIKLARNPLLRPGLDSVLALVSELMEPQREGTEESSD